MQRRRAIAKQPAQSLGRGSDWSRPALSQSLVCQAARTRACHPQETPRSQARKALTKFLQHFTQKLDATESTRFPQRHFGSLPPQSASRCTMRKANSAWKLSPGSSQDRRTAILPASQPVLPAQSLHQAPPPSPPQSLSVQTRPAAGATASTRCSVLLHSKSKRARIENASTSACSKMPLHLPKVAASPLSPLHACCRQQKLSAHLSSSFLRHRCKLVGIERPPAV